MIGNEASRRGFIGTALALGAVPAACSAAPKPPRPHRARKPGDPPLLEPSAAWDGTAGSGGTAPTESAVPRGTLVPDERFTGGFSAIPGQWAHGEGVRITALGLPPQAADSDEINYFKEAVFFLEGATATVTEWSVNDMSVRMHDGSMAPQGSIGFTVEIGAGLGAVTAGDAVLHCYLRGEHGLERHIELPLVINVDRALDADRDVRYVDPQGDDAARGTQDRPWRTLLRALGEGGVGDGGKVVLARAGRYVEDRNGIAGVQGQRNRRMIEVVAGDGIAPADVLVTRTSRLLPEHRWVVKANRVHFHGVTVDLGAIPTMEGSFKGFVLAFSGCRLVDPAGPNGPVDRNGYDIGYNLNAGPMPMRDGTLSPFAVRNGRVFVTESLLVDHVTSGANLYRNVIAFEATDSLVLTGNASGLLVDGYTAIMTRDFHSRTHLEPDLIVASTRPAGGMTVVTLAGSPSIWRTGRRNDCQAQIVSGAAAGADRLQVDSADPDRFELVLDDPRARQLRAGDRLRYYMIWHSDFLQQQGALRPTDTGADNTTIFRYHARSPVSQLMLTQAAAPPAPGTTLSTEGRRFTLQGPPNVVLPNDVLHLTDGPQKGAYRMVARYDPATGSGELLDAFDRDVRSTPIGRGKTITGMAVALSILHKYGNGFTLGQLQDGHRNVVLAQNTFLGQPLCLSFRNNNPGHGNRNHVHLFNIYSRLDADTPELPTFGVRVQRNHFVGGRARGKEARLGAPGFPPLDLRSVRFDYRPKAGVQTFGRPPLIPFDASGRPIGVQSPVGAVT